jgi:NAD(P)H-quinone oxidoreductase subunit K
MPLSLMGKFGELSENVVSNDVVIDCSRKVAIIPKIIYGGTKLMTSSIINPVERAEITQQLSENIILTTVDDIYNWVKMSSLYPLMFGTACCFMEFMAAYASRFDLERYEFPGDSATSTSVNYWWHNYYDLGSQLQIG